MSSHAEATTDRLARVRLAVRGGLGLGAGGAWFFASARPASAHGIGGDAGDASVGAFVGIGIEHMLLGWDHLLFVAGILLLAGSAKRAAGVISAFVVGHSLTLITATLAGWQVNATMVDAVIVLSVAFVGGWGMIGRPRRWDIFTAIVFGFGLIHGLGLATRFQALGVPEENLLWRLIAFNIGIEIGQVTAIFIAYVVASLVTTSLGSERRTVLAKGSFAALFMAGVVVAPLMAYQGFTDLGGQGVTEATLPDGADCTIEDRRRALPSAGGGHTGKTFYGPDEQVPLQDLGHSLGDGFVIVLYPADLDPGDIAALRDFVASGDPEGVMAGHADDLRGQVEVLTIRQQMTCESVHVGALRQFSRAWIESIGATT